MHTNILQLIHPVMYICTPTTLFSPHPQNKPYIPLSTFKTHFPITPNYHNLSFSTPTDTLHIHYKAKLASPHSTCMAVYCKRLDTAPHFYPLFFSAFVVSRTLSSFTPLAFTLAYHTHHTYGLSLIVEVCILAACSPPGSVHLYYISCYVQDEMAYHLYPILCTLDTVTACTPSPFSFHLGCGYNKVTKKCCFFSNQNKCVYGWNPQKR